MEPELTLEKTKTMVYHREAVRNQQRVLKDGTVVHIPIDIRSQQTRWTHKVSAL